MCHLIVPFWSEDGYTLSHFGLESGMVFEGTTECINVFIISIANEKEDQREKERTKEREICEFETDLNNFSVCALI